MFFNIDTISAVVVKYEYDAWGNHTVKDNNGRVITSGIGVLNPFRYRGYYYDTETGLYYLQTRYYDPEIGRFISQDSIEYADPETINGLNLYAYCGNNPVNYLDPTGNAAWWQWLLFGVAATVIVAATVVATITTGGVALAAFAIAAGGMGAMIGNFLEQGVTKGWNNIDVGEVGIMSLSGAFYGLACTLTGGAALFAKAGVSALTFMAMTLYESEGKASFGEVVLSGVEGFALSIALQKIGGIVLDKLTYSPASPLWGSAVKPNLILAQAAGISLVGKMFGIVKSAIFNILGG